MKVFAIVFELNLEVKLTRLKISVRQTIRSSVQNFLRNVSKTDYIQKSHLKQVLLETVFPWILFITVLRSSLYKRSGSSTADGFMELKEISHPSLCAPCLRLK